MKTLFRGLLVVLVLALASDKALADGPLTPGATATTPSATHGDSCTPINANAAINTTVTLTIPAVAGQFINVSGLDITLANDNTGAGTSVNLTWTTTNMGSWTYKFSDAGTANTMKVDHWIFGTPMKAPIAGTAVTFVSPAVNAHAIYNINACYFYSSN